MDENLIPLFAIVTLFIGLPWLVFHYITRWKTAATLSQPDEKLLDDLYEMARRLDERMCSIERIMTAENPEWRQNCLPGNPTSGARPALERFEELERRSDELLARRPERERR